MAKSFPEKFPPELGPPSGNRRQIDIGVSSPFIVFCRRPGPVYPHKQRVIQIVNVTGAVFLYFISELAKVSFNGALSIFYRNVKAYELPKGWTG